MLVLEACNGLLATIVNNGMANTGKSAIILPGITLAVSVVNVLILHTPQTDKRMLIAFLQHS